MNYRVKDRIRKFWSSLWNLTMFSVGVLVFILACVFVSTMGALAYRIFIFAWWGTVSCS